ncbi:hypothetical protein ACI6Q2_04635 [Chitinophagaceae bacterium LWZ2-11]
MPNISDQNEQSDLQRELSNLDNLPPEGFFKRIKYAQRVLFLVAAMQLISILSVFIQDGSTSLKIVNISMFGFVGTVYLVLALFIKKRPYTVIHTALIFFLVMVTIGVYRNPQSLTGGLIIKFIFCAYLIYALKAAKDVEAWNKLKEKL